MGGIKMKSLNVYKILPFLLLAMLSVSCQTSNPSTSVRHVENENIDSRNPRARLVLGSDVLLGNVAIVDPRFRQLGHLNQAQVSVQNLTNEQYALEYKFDWESADGFVGDSQSSWHRFTLSPKQLQIFKSTGKTPEERNIVFTVRLPNNLFLNKKKQNKESNEE